jgi:hypothetical protein
LYLLTIVHHQLTPLQSNLTTFGSEAQMTPENPTAYFAPSPLTELGWILNSKAALVAPHITSPNVNSQDAGPSTTQHGFDVSKEVVGLGLSFNSLQDRNNITSATSGSQSGVGLDLGSSADNTSTITYNPRSYEAREDMTSLQAFPNDLGAYNFTFADESTNKAALIGPNCPLLLYRFPKDQAGRDDLYNLMFCQDDDCVDCVDCEAVGQLAQ